MQKLKYLTSAFLVVILMIGCGEEFLNDPPDSAIPFEEFISTPEEAQQMLNGAYDALSFGSVFGGQFQLISELMADGTLGDLIDNGDWRAHYTRTTDIFLGTTRSMMADAYKAAGRANNLLANLDDIAGLSEGDRSRMRGEAVFIRGVVLFELVRFFGQPHGYTANNDHLGIVARTSFGKEVLPRVSVKVVYDQVISDFNEAIGLLPDENGHYADKNSARGYLARVYFQMNDFTNALTQADAVIESGKYTFDNDIRAKFGYGSSGEVIFGFVSTDINSDNANGSLRGYFRIDASLGTAALYPSEDIVNAIATAGGDVRRESFLNEDGVRPVCVKFAVDSVYKNPTLHLTELKLIRSESLAELNQDISKGVSDLNDIRERAGSSPLSININAAQLKAQTRAERQVELFFENNRLHELKRQATRDSPDLKIRGADWDCPGMVCQFPDGELKGNPDMIPNPQGGCN